MGHAALHIFTSDLVSLACERKRVIPASHTLLDVAQNHG
jgi:hypothetical protein